LVSWGVLKSGLHLATSVQHAFSGVGGVASFGCSDSPQSVWRPSIQGGLLKTQFTLDNSEDICYSRLVMKSRPNRTVRSRSLKSALGRTIHLVDLENLMGSCVMSSADVALVRQQYEAVSGACPADHVVIATGPTAAPNAWFGWGVARRLLRCGVDGADAALLEVIELEHLTRRFRRVVVASGDGIFADACSVLQSKGCEVTVVTRPEALSVRLRLAVRDVRYLYLAAAETLAQRVV
jgi:hypothetical protein